MPYFVLGEGGWGGVELEVPISAIYEDGDFDVSSLSNYPSSDVRLRPCVRSGGYFAIS